MKRHLVVCLALLAWSEASVSQEKIALHSNIAYRKVDGMELMLDFAKPPRGSGPFPLVVCVHGGAWQAGSRVAHHRTIRLLASRGFAAATIQYRLAPRAKYPAQLEDIREAVRFLRGKAKDWEFHPDRIALLGDSAGGHLSLLAGLMDSPSDEKVPSRVQAIVNFYGPTDFRAWKLPKKGEVMLMLGLKKDSNGVLEDFLGTSDRSSKVIATASPITHIDSKDPPVLTFNGTEDPLVPDDQARILHKALDKQGVINRLEILEGAGHGWGGKNLERTDRITLEFLEKHLR